MRGGEGGSGRRHGIMRDTSYDIKETGIIGNPHVSTTNMTTTLGDPKFQIPLSRCKGCPNKDQPCVSGAGPSDAQVAFVGERPGRVEVKIGRPFVGPAGQLLDQLLSRVGIDLDSVYRTNVCLCFHPKNKAPKPVEMRACWTRLLTELSTLKPHLKMVVALGAVATKHLLDTKKGVTWMRGRILEYPSLDCDFGVTYHPAAVLRNPELYPDILFDLQRISQYL